MINYNFSNDDLKETYEYLHKIPEPEHQEFKTSAYISDFLKNLNLEVVSCTDTGLYADIKSSVGDGLTILFRADIDALPLTEESGVAFSSQHNGYMHACGHDMHTACLLYAAKALSENRDAFTGKIRVLFQPAEEGDGGAKQMIENGALEGVDAAVAMHADPLADSGTVLYRNGSITASPDDYKIIIKGKGGHGAEPDKCINPLSVAAGIINEYNNIKTNYFSGDESVTTVCTCHGGTLNNIIPETAEITGTARAFDTKTRYALRDKLASVCKKMCSEYKADYEFIYNELFPPTVNDTSVNDVVVSAASITEGIKGINELEKGSMTGDDFSYFAQSVPSSYFRFGVGGDGERYPLHSPKFKVNEDSLMIACRLLVNIALKYLA